MSGASAVEHEDSGAGRARLVRVSEDRPLWRQGYDVIERQIGPRLDEVIRSEQFAIAIGLIQQGRRSLQQRAERTSRRMLHLANLPAASDVSRLLAEIGELQRQVRELEKQRDKSK
jgi:hypothetical protein